MATSDVDICNLALVHVGQSEFISDINENTTAARILKVVYGQLRDKVLESCWWPFATKHATLALLDYTRSGWGYAYSLPTDCLAPQYIFNGMRRGAPLVSLSAVVSPLLLNTSPLPLAGVGMRVPFTLEVSDDLDAKILLTDQTVPELIYTAALEDAGMFTAEFCDAFSYLLAERLARSLLKKPELAAALKKEFQMEIAKAWASVLRDLQEDTQPDSEFIAVRG